MPSLVAYFRGNYSIAAAGRHAEVIDGFWRSTDCGADLCNLVRRRTAGMGHSRRFTLGAARLLNLDNRTPPSVFHDILAAMRSRSRIAPSISPIQAATARPMVSG